jgi:hypothetical protein
MRSDRQRPAAPARVHFHARPTTRSSSTRALQQHRCTDWGRTPAHSADGSGHRPPLRPAGTATGTGLPSSDVGTSSLRVTRQPANSASSSSASSRSCLSGGSSSSASDWLSKSSHRQVRSSAPHPSAFAMRHRRRRRRDLCACQLPNAVEGAPVALRVDGVGLGGKGVAHTVAVSPPELIITPAAPRRTPYGTVIVPPRHRCGGELAGV